VSTHFPFGWRIGLVIMILDEHMPNKWSVSCGSNAVATKITWLYPHGL